MAQSLTPRLLQTISKKYTVDNNTGVWVAKSQNDFDYSDGDKAESYIYHSLKTSGDVSCSSDELALRIKDWPSEYHLSPSRHNLLIPLQIEQGTKILELGCGMGAITRYLGEIDADVTAVEGSIRRAVIAKERCRDLNNVAIVCDNFKDFITNERFDIVTLIGVLEYSPKYIGGHNPISECLKIARKYLKPEGSLLIAIENRLGLKYWNNCAEDHTGGMFDSIHDNYPVGTVVTFGYAEIKQILTDAGFASVQFLFPFPDYKLARVILNEDSFNHKEINFASMIGQTYSRDYSGQPYRNFSERLAWHTLEKNELIPQFSNSFLVIANMSSHSSSLDVKKWIAKIYSSDRNACFRTETSIFKDMESDKLLVNKERLYKELPIKEGLLQFNDDIEKHYIEGILFSDEILKLFLQRDPYNAFVQKMTEYKNFIINLNKKRNPTGRTDYCSGELIDCTPFNLVRQKDKSLHYIDNEWRMSNDIPLMFILLRGIIGELLSKINYIKNPELFRQHANLNELAVDIFKRMGMQLTEDDIEYYCQHEALIQVQVTASQSLKKKMTQRFKTLFYIPLKDALNIITKLPSWEICRLHEHKLQTKDRQLQTAFDQCASAYCDLGTAQFEKGEQGRALEYYEKAVKIDPGNIGYQKKWAEFLHKKLTRTEEAMQIYLEILKKHPEDIETLIALGNFCVTNRLSDKAKFFYEKALSLDPQNKTLREKLTDVVKNPINSNQKKVQIEKQIQNIVSVIILTFNQIKYTKECVESIRKYTPEPHEIIFIDNGSTDGTANWLKGLIKKNTNYKLIENRKNLGFAKGCNQGITASTGEYILLLNNDVVVTEGWLSGMLECLTSTSDTGIVGPMTNNISGPQKVADANHTSMHHLSEYARTFKEIHRYRRIPFRRIVGFCMLFRRELVERIGFLDESFGSGNFEDDDFSLRAALKGYKNFIAGDVFIHHYGNVSFIGNKINYNSSIGKNKKIFDEKWRNIDASSPQGKNLAVLNKLESAEKFYQQQQIDQAIITLIDGIKYSPDNKAIYYRLAEMLIDSKRFSDAMDALKSMPKEGKKEAKWHALAGYGKQGMELYAEAGEHADKALSLHTGCALAYNLKGILAYKKRDENSAEDYFRKAIKCDPSYGGPHTNLGLLKWAQGTNEDALNLLEKGFILSPTIEDIVSLYHSAIKSVGEFERAEQRFRGAKASYPLNKRVTFLLIDILLQQGKNEIAMQEIEQAMISFGIDDGMMAAALEIRNRIGSRDIDKSKKSGTLSVCMIVKNEENHIARCLTSALPVADEMIVVDTGSTDRTKDIAAAFGAKVFEFPWTGDFSEARNFSLSKASGDWIFVLDADEVISSRDYDPLKGIILKKNPQPAAYDIFTRNYVGTISALGWVPNKAEYPHEETGTGWFPSVKIRLFPNDDRIRFKGQVHELVESSITTAGIKIKPCNIIIHHYGKMNTTGKIISKGEAYYLLGRKKLKERPDDLKSLCELATQAQELKRFEEAIELWERAIDLTREKSVASFFFNMGYCLLQTGQYEKALLASKRAMEIDPNMKEALLNYCYNELLVGDYKKVISELESMLEQAVEYPPASLLLAAAYCIAGKKDKALISYKSFFKKGFIFADSQNILGKRLAALGKTDSAVRVLEAIIESGNGNDATGRLLDECLKRGPTIDRERDDAVIFQ
ncbi:MAG: glycosyltransferase [Deltaproteobacteria bacterium]|nr:glycosyltransferase [Deltaproteobacteria bacterium]